MRFLRGAVAVVDRLEDTVLTISLVAICFLVTLQVFSRYVLGQSLSWSEELNRAIFIYLVMVGVSAGVRHENHMGIRLLVERLPFAVRHAVEILVWLCSLALCVVILREAVSLLQTQQQFRQTSPAIAWPIWWFTLAIPLGMLLTMLRVTQKLVGLSLDWHPTVEPSVADSVAQATSEPEKLAGREQVG